MNRILAGGLAALIIVAFSAVSSHALVIVPDYIDGAGQTWTAERKGVIQQAIYDWQARVPDNHTVNVTLNFEQAGTGGYLGVWSGYVSTTYGTNLYPWTPDVTQTISFNADRFTGDHYTWWDPTPSTGNDLPWAGWDALSIARHELGHMLGFTESFYYDNFGNTGQTDKWVSHISGTVFDPGGLSVLMMSADDLSHVANSGTSAGDLMTTSIYNGIRRGISNLDVQMLRLAYGYSPPYSNWVSLGAGNFNLASNWTNNTVPNGVDSTANFLGTITAPSTVSLSSNVTLGSLEFNSPQSYTLAGTSSLTLQVSSGNASISVMAGIHHLNVPVVLRSNTVISGAGTLDLAGGISGNYALNVQNTLTATSIRVDTLTIGSPGAATVPEPSVLVLLGMAAVVLPISRRRRRKRQTG